LKIMQNIKKGKTGIEGPETARQDSIFQKVKN
jgi:hypothetical protein